MVQFRDDIINHAVSWQEVHRDIRILAHRLLGIGSWRGIIAVTRGGLVPAAILARELDIHLIDTVCILSYDEQVQGDVNILKKPDFVLAENNEGEGWLLIDDIVDTGATVKAARKLLPKAYFASVYAKPESRELVDTIVHEVSQDTWIFFPWDTEPQYVRPLAQANSDK